MEGKLAVAFLSIFVELFRLEHSIEKNRATFCRCPVVPCWSDPKRHVALTFQRSFQKTIVNGKQPQYRFAGP